MSGFGYTRKNNHYDRASGTHCVIMKWLFTLPSSSGETACATQSCDSLLMSHDPDASLSPFLFSFRSPSTTSMAWTHLVAATAAAVTDAAPGRVISVQIAVA